MDPRTIPPELLAGQPVQQGPGGYITPPPGGSFVDGPTAPDPMSPSGMPMDMGGGTPLPPPDALMSPLAPGFPIAAPQNPGGGQDAVLAQLLQEARASGPVSAVPDAERRGKVPKPRVEDILAIAERDRQRYASTVDRMGRDVALFRQHEGSVPRSFKVDRETAIQSAEFSTLVNKLSNMFSGADQIYEVPYDTMPEEKSAQIIEDALYQLRKLAKRTYAYQGGNLQRDEFFYMFLHGRYVKRTLPDLHDKRYPFAESLLDPSTCFPTYGGPKKGMIRMVRKYTTTVADVITDYGEAVPDLEKKLAKKLGFDSYSSAVEWGSEEGEVIEYWDSWWRYVTFRGEEVMPVTAHKIGQVPFTYIMPTGEPGSMSTPGGRYMSYSVASHTTEPYLVGPEADLAEKGVSIYHYLVKTHKVKEMLMTILYNEVEKATDPATITYTAPHLGGNEPEPLDTKRGGNNVRQMNFQQVEGVPTSPRPTDFSPLFSTIQQEMIEGSFPPGMFGAEQGSNVTGSGTDAMLQQAKDLVQPYIDAWQYGQAQEAELKLRMYVDIISPVITISAPERDPRGDGVGEINDLSPMDIRAVGTQVEVKMIGLTLGSESQLIASMNQAVQAGFMSQRHAMGRLNVQNPDKMFSEIISEKAMQHPEMMDSFIIPEGFKAMGMEEAARMWVELVVAPKMAQMAAQGMGGGQPPAPGGGGVGSQAVPDPLQGITEQAPGGPSAGQGRGPEQGNPLEGLIG